MTMLRFVIQGSLNSLITFLTYIVLLQWFNYAVSYTAAFALGILFAYFVNRTFVFRATGSRRAFFLFCAVYLVLYAVGLTITSLLVPQVGPVFAPLGALTVTVPLSFLMARFVFAHT
jgi:putative flippase GtrA